MELDELKGTWQQAGSSAKSKEELNQMTSLRKNPRLKRIKVRLMIESILTLILIIIAITGLDGGEKPLWINITLVAAGLIYILNRVVGFQKLKSPNLNGTTKSICEAMLEDLKRLSTTSTVSALFLTSALILFLTININFTAQKGYTLVGMIITMFSLIYLSTTVWRRQIDALKSVIDELSEKNDDLV